MVIPHCTPRSYPPSLHTELMSSVMWWIHTPHTTLGPDQSPCKSSVTTPVRLKRGSPRQYRYSSAEYDSSDLLKRGSPTSLGIPPSSTLLYTPPHSQTLL